MSPRVVLASLALVITGCEGPQGPVGADGNNPLISTTTEPAGANCATGGTKIEAGIDANDNGTLEPAEITNTYYACNGSGGVTSLFAQTPEPVGANCPFGGTKIETGLDANGDGTLDASEVDADATTYVCAFGPAGAVSPSTGIVAAVKANGVSLSPAAPITVRFTLKDDRGYPIDINGVYSANTAIQPRFALAYFTTDTNDIVSPLTVYTKSGTNPTMFGPRGSTTQGTLVENGLGAGDYTYTFPSTGTTAVAYDANKLNETHVVWIQATRQTDLVFTANANTFSASNVPYYYIPSGTGTPSVREIAAQSNCNNCHEKFKAETVASSQFHGGGRIDAAMCNVCHNPGRSNPLADSVSFVHRIHASEQIATANLFHDIEITYPRDTRDCTTCHANSAQGAQIDTNPSERACKGCHDYVAFDGSAPATCGVQGNLARGPDGKPLPCDHFAGPQPECVSCHGPMGAFASTKYHVPVRPPDPASTWAGGTNSNTNAAWLAAGGYVPAGADAITYDIKSVDAVADAAITPNLRPSITFKLKRNGTDVVFENPLTATEIMPDFQGSPSVYFAFAVPQDGITAPADFNATVSGYIKKIWNGTAPGSISGPDSGGYYTIVLTNVQVPSTAVMLTGGVGFGYSLSSTPPLVQTNVPGYPLFAGTGGQQGGLSVPSPVVTKVATGYTGRRQIVDTNKCNNCHGQLGIAPTFHAGQRDSAPACAFCHTQNRTSSGWAAASKYFIHAIHAGRKRTVPYTWHAAAVGEGYDEIEFPGTLNTCTTCHFPNTYDFTNSTNLAAIPRMPYATVATNTYNSNPLTNSTYYRISPYVIADNVTNYGSGFSFTASSGTYTDAAPTTLVLSRLVEACSACHDSPESISHMEANGGLFYEPRSVALSSSAPVEQCMLCHGLGWIVAIGAVHQR